MVLLCGERFPKGITSFHIKAWESNELLCREKGIRCLMLGEIVDGSKVKNSFQPQRAQKICIFKFRIASNVTPAL
jgi:hypothetical protein